MTPSPLRSRHHIWKLPNILSHKPSLLGIRPALSRRRHMNDLEMCPALSLHVKETDDQGGALTHSVLLFWEADLRGRIRWQEHSCWDMPPRNQTDFVFHDKSHKLSNVPPTSPTRPIERPMQWMWARCVTGVTPVAAAVDRDFFPPSFHLPSTQSPHPLRWPFV